MLSWTPVIDRRVAGDRALPPRDARRSWQAARAAALRPGALAVGFDVLEIADAPRVGAKAASLGEMHRTQCGQEVRVPNGFATTVDAFRHYLDAESAREAWSGLAEELRVVEPGVLKARTLRAALERLFRGASRRRPEDLEARAELARALMEATPPPEDIRAAITECQRALKAAYGADVPLVVRPSPAWEDPEIVSLGARFESFLNVRETSALIDAWARCCASAFSPEAVRGRVALGLHPLEARLGVVVMKMVRSDLAASGVASTIDPKSGNRNVVRIASTYGLGDSAGNGDTYLVWKEGVRCGKPAVVHREIGSKEQKLVCSSGEASVESVDVGVSHRRRWSITRDEALELARMAGAVEEHFGQAVEVEWAKDGYSGELFILKVRAEAGGGTTGGIARPSLETGILLSLGIPTTALHDSMLSADGVGLARTEFMMTNQVGVHPLALAHFEHLRDFSAAGVLSPELEPFAARLEAEDPRELAALLLAIERRAFGHGDPRQFFLDQVGAGIALICAAFHPRPVRVRLSALEAYEYRRLLGGKLFEPTGNPSTYPLRGTERFLDPRSAPGLEVELEAMRVVRQTFGFDNLQIVAPPFRSPEDGARFVAFLDQFGLSPSAGVPLFLTLALPSNLTSVSRFIEEMGLAGGVVGADDLLMMARAIAADELQDRGSPPDPSAEAVRAVIGRMLEEFRRRGLELDVLAQLPSGHSTSMLRYLVECGISSISTAPETLPEVRMAVAEAEVRRRGIVH